MDNIIVVNNSILLNSLTKLRDKNLKSSQFRKEVSNIAKILLFEALKNEETEMRRIQTPFVESDFPSLNENEYVLVPILRAGLPMMEGCLEILEDAKVGFLAIKRDETTLESKVYYERLPHLEEKTVIILDPMVATAGSITKAIGIIESHNPKKIISLNIVVSKVGTEKLSKFKNVKFYVGSAGEDLNDKGYIVPGIGDAGDRCFNTY